MIRAATALLPLALAACGGAGREAGPWMGFDPGPVPAELARGEVLYNTYCLSCHGRHGRGEGLGPPLLDSLYQPARLADTAFFQAVERGTNQRYWNYGAMPPLPRVTPPEMAQIIPYIRWVQQRAGPAPAAAAGR